MPSSTPEQSRLVGPSTLHVIRARDAGEAAAFAPRAHDPVLVIGQARDARAVVQILNRPVHHMPEPNFAGAHGVARAIERVRRATGAGAVIRHGGGNRPGDRTNTPDLGRLPCRVEARRALGFTDELVLAPLSDRPASVDARTLMFIAGVIGIIGERIALVLPRKARRLGEALAYHRGARVGSPCRIVDDAWLWALPAADVLIAPIDLEADPAAPVLGSIGEHLHLPIAVTAAWHRDPDAATNSLPAEIRATVAPVLARARAVRAARSRDGVPAETLPV